jgi:hypothetical protein
MSNDVERRLNGLTPRGVRPEVRERVLGAVARELDVGAKESRSSGIAVLSAKTESTWLHRASVPVAAGLVLGIVLNVWASRTSERNLARLFGPAPISKEAMQIAKDVESVTDAETGDWVYRRLSAPRRSGGGVAAYTKHYEGIRRLIDEIQTVSKDTYHETPEKDAEMERNRTGWIGGHSADCQCLVRVDHRYTA